MDSIYVLLNVLIQVVMILRATPMGWLGKVETILRAIDLHIMEVAAITAVMEFR